MTLKIFLDEKGFHCLKDAVPARSRSRLVVEEAVRLKFFGSNFVITCDEAEAENLLIYAGHCPSIVASIDKALRSAGALPGGDSIRSAMKGVLKKERLARRTNH